MITPLYPNPTWSCGVCGRENPGDIGFCPSCRGGAIIRDDPRPSGGLENGSIPYYPMWHVVRASERNEIPFHISDGLLPTPEKYPHTNRRVRP